MDPALVDWLIAGAVGPALVALPVNWTASDLSRLARRWFRRLRHADGLSRLVQAAGASAGLTRGEFASVRRLLESQKTWQLIASGTVEQLAEKIDSCLREDRDPRANSLVAARAIAQGLLEFAVFDLESEVFQRVLLARLARLETKQAAALDQAMLWLNADLVAWCAQQSYDDDQQVRRVMTQLGQVLDRLPPSAASREEVALYLTALIRWMNTDPWPRDPRLRGPVLTPAAIERKLIVTGTAATEERQSADEDADALACQCSRLVILGGPGSGKTWLARRIARRCANAALQALTVGVSLDEIELPLFTTCSLLVGERGNIRDAAVASALDQLGDLGGSRIADALRTFFTERNAPTLLVIDSLDEARSPDARLRQADTLPWRIVLTSRPSSWNQQLSIDEEDTKHRVGSLRPLRYPTDVRAFIARWFAHEPDLGRALLRQIVRQPRFQEAATVPLILAFYCLIGGDQPLPATRRELYPLVLRRILTGLWRGSGGESSDPNACLATLREWAWAGAASDQISGLGTWADEIPTPHVRMSQSDQAAVDHVATPLILENLDTGITLRRFIHRSIREHLTAEYVATQMTSGEAATELLKHLWYDPDWEYVAPAALLMHPERHEVLNRLICQAGDSQEIPSDFASIDGCGELPRFLAKLAMESTEADWTAESAAIISRPRLDLGLDGLLSDLRQAPGWEASDDPTRQALLTQLTRENDARTAGRLAEKLVRLNPIPEECEQACESLLDLLAQAKDAYAARMLAEAVLGLNPTPQECEQASESLLDLLAQAKDAYTASTVAHALPRLEPNPGQRERASQALLALLTRESSPWQARGLAEELAKLQPGPGQRERAGQALLALLTRESSPWQARGLAEELAKLQPGPGQRERAGQALLALLTRESSPWQARGLAEELAKLQPGPGQRERAGQALLALLDGATDVRAARTLAEALLGLQPGPGQRERAGQALLALLDGATDVRAARTLAEALLGLQPGPGQRERAGQALLALLDGATDVRAARTLAEALLGLQPGPGQRERAGQALLALLSRENSPWKARDLAQALILLDPSLGQREQAGQALLALLARENEVPSARRLAEALAKLDLNPGQREQAGQALMALLARQDAQSAGSVAETLAALGPHEREQAGQALMALLARQDAQSAGSVAETLAALGPHEREQAGQALLTLLARETDPKKAQDLTGALARLTPSPNESEQARQALLALLARQHDPYKARDLAIELAGINPGLDEREQAAQAILALLARENDARFAAALAEALPRLDPNPDQQQQATQALLAMLARENDAESTRMLARALVGLDPDPQQQEQAAQAILAMLTRAKDARSAVTLTAAIARLDPNPRQRQLAAHALLPLLARQNARLAGIMARTVALLGPQERGQAAQAILALLARESDPWKARDLARQLAKLDPNPDERERAAQALLPLLAREKEPWKAQDLAKELTFLDLGLGQREQTGQLLLALLAREKDARFAAMLAAFVGGAAVSRGYAMPLIGLNLGPDQRGQAGFVLLALLTRTTDAKDAAVLAGALAGLDLGLEEREQAGQILLALLARENDPSKAQELVVVLAKLDLGCWVLESWRSWAVVPGRDLLIRARWNSTLSSWLKVLPTLSSLPA